MVPGDSFPDSALAASRRTAMLAFNFITVLSRRFRLSNLTLTYITGPSRATFGFADRLAVGAKVLLGPGTPVNAAGIGVLLVSVVVHFLGAQITARTLYLGRMGFGCIHNPKLCCFLSDRITRPRPRPPWRRSTPCPRRSNAMARARRDRAQCARRKRRRF